MLRIPPDRPLSVETWELLQAVRQVTAANDIEHFVIGATARDILMQHVFGIDTGRATRDVDFAIAIQDWTQFEQIRQQLIETGQFHETGALAHRLYFKSAEYGEAYPLDLIPFGAVEHRPHQIAWPPDMTVVMNVAGYGEALESALVVETGDLLVRVVSLPGLAALKLLAWADRYQQSSKDATDLRFLMEHYHKAGNSDRLYDEIPHALARTGYDVALAGAFLLGVDTRRMLAPATLHAMLSVLHSPILRDRLTLHMSRAMTERDRVAEESIAQFHQGLTADIPA